MTTADGRPLTTDKGGASHAAVCGRRSAVAGSKVELQTNNPLIAILGPTAVGKTALAIQLAREFLGEIVSADSRQVYRGMDIGTAKPSAEERRAVPHHLLGVVNPD